MRARLVGEGPPVVLLHGQPGGARDWELVVPLLADCALLVPDRPGYDGTPAGGFFGNAERVIDLLDEHGIERAVVAGYSWGGGAALATSFVAPDRVAGLALISSVGARAAYGAADRALAWRPAGAAFAAIMRAAGPAVAAAMVRASGSSLDQDALEHVSVGLELARRGPIWRSFNVEQRALLRESPALEARLGEIDVPAVVLAGRRDGSVPVAAARALAGALPRASLRELDAGHLLPLEAPLAVAAGVREAVRLAGLDSIGGRRPAVG